MSSAKIPNLLLGLAQVNSIALYICVLQSQDRCPHIPAYAMSAILGTPYVLCMQDVAGMDLHSSVDVAVISIHLRKMYRIALSEQFEGSCCSPRLMLRRLEVDWALSARDKMVLRKSHGRLSPRIPWPLHVISFHCHRVPAICLVVGTSGKTTRCATKVHEAEFSDAIRGPWW